jgi:hypothetical protein
MEPETQNLVELIAQIRFTYVVDVHMYGRQILFPWGIEQNQSNDTTQSFGNPLWNFQRDGNLGTAYAEFIPNNFVTPRGPLLDRLLDLARQMAAAIRASAGGDSVAIRRSKYQPQQSSVPDPVTGTLKDFAFSLQFLDPTLPNVHAFTLEAGRQGGDNPADPADDDGAFWPDSANQYPKVEREIHAALFALLSAI